MYTFLVTIRESAHSTHHPQDVIVSCINTHSAAQVQAYSVVADGQQQGGVINTGQVASAAGLVLLRLQCKAVYVDTNSGDVGVVLVGLYPVEVCTFTDLETIVTVELQ